MIFWSPCIFIWFRNMKKMLLQMTSVSLQPVQSLDKFFSKTNSEEFVTITSGGDVTGCNLTPVGRGMPRAPVPFFGCGGTPHGRGSSAE
jgi:hypothetical protein